MKIKKKREKNKEFFFQVMAVGLVASDGFKMCLTSMLPRETITTATYQERNLRPMVLWITAKLTLCKAISIGNGVLAYHSFSWTLPLRKLIRKAS